MLRIQKAPELYWVLGDVFIEAYYTLFDIEVKEYYIPFLFEKQKYTHKRIIIIKFYRINKSDSLAMVNVWEGGKKNPMQK